jgi:uncharacterized delta-60 repeat protein
MWTAPDSTQRILAAGNATGGTSATNSIAVARYNTDGTLDTSFGSGGIASNHLSTGEALFAMALQPDGTIVGAGETFGTRTSNDVLVARYTANGALDTTFNGTGWVSTDINRIENMANAVGLQSTGKIVAAGFNGFYQDSLILRYTSTGKLDSGSGGFGQADKHGSPLGYTIMSMGSAGPDSQINALAIQPDDKIVTVGEDYDGNLVNGQLTLMRFTADGLPDTTFNGGSPVLFPPSIPGWSSGYAVALQPDGKIIVAGDAGPAGISRNSPGFNMDFFVARYNSDGTPDMTFNNGTGSIRIDISSGSYDKAYGVAIDGSGRIVVGGDWQQTAADQSITYGAAVARLNPDGTMDTTFGTNGVKTGALLPTPSYSTSTFYAVNGLAIANDGSYYLVGTIHDPTSGNGFRSILLVHFLP